MTLLSAGTARNKKRRQQGVKTESNTPGSGRNGNCVSARLAAQQRLPRRCQKASIKGRVAGLAPKTSNQRGVPRCQRPCLLNVGFVVVEILCIEDVLGVGVSYRKSEKA